MENEMLKLIETRRSCRKYLSRPIEEEKLDAVLRAGTFAPTGGGHQSPVIVAVRDDAAKSELTRLNARVMGDADACPYYGAPCILLVLAKGSASTCVEDGSCVLDTMMLAAHSLGLASVWVHREREIFDSPEGKALLRSWGLPDTLRGVGSLAIGYPDGDLGSASPRKDDYIVKI